MSNYIVNQTNWQLEISGQLSGDFCFKSWQDVFEKFIEALIIKFPLTFAGIYVSQDLPPVGDRDKLWLKYKEVGGQLSYELLKWNGSGWCRALNHPLPPGTIVPYYNPTLTNDHNLNKAIISYLDIPETEAIRDISPGNEYNLYSNPYWCICDGQTIDTDLGEFTPPDLRGRMVVGAGEEVASEQFPRKKKDYLEEGGEEEHKLTVAELPSYQTSVKLYKESTVGMLGAGGYGAAVENIDIGGGNSPHNNMPPYMALYWIIRTNRL